MKMPIPPIQRLFELFATCGVTQTAIAERLGVSTAMLTYWVSGQKPVAPAQHIALYNFAVESILRWGQDDRPKRREDILALKSLVEEVYTAHATSVQRAYESVNTAAAILAQHTARLTTPMQGAAAILADRTARLTTPMQGAAAKLPPMAHEVMEKATGDYEAVMNASIRAMTHFRDPQYLALHLQEFPLPEDFFEELLEQAA